MPIGSPALVFVQPLRRCFRNTSLALQPIAVPAPGECEKNAPIWHENKRSGFIETCCSRAATKNIEIALVATSPPGLAERPKAAEPLQAGSSQYYNDFLFNQMWRGLDPAARFLLFFSAASRVGCALIGHACEAPSSRQRSMNGIFSHQLGTGIVGGRLLDGDRLGKEAAAVAIRILRGESPSSIPPVILERLPPRYDWRELQRWKIDEKLLPPGSTVLYQTPTVCQYRGWIIGAFRSAPSGDAYCRPGRQSDRRRAPERSRRKARNASPSRLRPAHLECGSEFATKECGFRTNCASCFNTPEKASITRHFRAGVSGRSAIA